MSIPKTALSQQIDKEQGNTHPKQNPMYALYMILERTGVDAVIRYLVRFNREGHRKKNKCLHSTRSFCRNTCT